MGISIGVRPCQDHCSAVISSNIFYGVLDLSEIQTSPNLKSFTNNPHAHLHVPSNMNQGLQIISFKERVITQRFSTVLKLGPCLEEMLQCICPFPCLLDIVNDAKKMRELLWSQEEQSSEFVSDTYSLGDLGQSHFIYHCSRQLRKTLSRSVDGH